MTEEDNALNKVKPHRPVPSKAWKPGQSGNPAGRPKKNHALSAILADASKKNLFIKVDGVVKKVTRNDLIAEILMLAVLNGQVIFPLHCDKDGNEEDQRPPLQLDTSEWIKLTDFYYKRVEGNPGTKPVEKVEDTSGMTKEEAEALGKKRWDEASSQLQEALTTDEGWVNDIPVD